MLKLLDMETKHLPKSVDITVTYVCVCARVECIHLKPRFFSQLNFKYNNWMLLWMVMMRYKIFVLYLFQFLILIKTEIYHFPFLYLTTTFPNPFTPTSSVHLIPFQSDGLFILFTFVTHTHIHAYTYMPKYTNITWWMYLVLLLRNLFQVWWVLIALGFLLLW